jgi:hypothetical protein
MDLASRQCTCSHGTVSEFLASRQIIVLEHHSYSLDLTPVTFSVLEDKGNIERRHFDDIDDIRSNTMAVLKDIMQNYFKNCFELVAGIGA